MSAVRRLVASALAVGVGLVLGAAPVAATGTHHGPDYYEPPTRYAEPYKYDPECEGQSLRVKGFVRGVDSTRNVRGSDGQAFLAMNAYSYRETWTNLANGKKFSVSGRAVFKEVSAKFVPNEDVPADLIPPQGLIGPVYLFTATEVGQPFVVRDKHGRVVLRDRGVLVSELLFDTKGDSEPGGTELSFEYTKIIGHFPGLDLDICELADRLTR